MLTEGILSEGILSEGILSEGIMAGGDYVQPQSIIADAEY